MPMPLEEVEKILKAKIADGKDLYDRLAQERTEEMDYYRGNLPLPPLDSERASNVSRDVRDTVHQILPSMVKIFMSSDKIVEYIPRSPRPQDVEAARQATQYFDFLVKTAGGLKLLYPVFSDALLRKFGTIIARVEEREDSTIENYQNVTQQTIDALLTVVEDGETVEIVSQEPTDGDHSAPEGGEMTEGAPLEADDPMNPGMMGPMAPPQTFNLRLRRTSKCKKLNLEAMPPESRWIDPNAVDVETSSFWACVRETTVGDLLALGYDEALVKELKSGPVDDTQDKTERNPQHRDDRDGAQEEDPSLRRVPFGEAYLRFDYEGDGKPRLYRVCFAGAEHRVLCDPEEIARPYAAEFPVIPEPHTATGRSVAGEMLDIQDTKTTLLRGMFDSLGQSIFPQRGFQDGAVSVEDLKNSEPGALVRCKGVPAQMVQEWVREFAGGQVLPVLEYMDEMGEARSGTSKAAAGLDADALQSTSVMAAGAVISASRAQVELMARVLAEYGMVPLAKIVLDAAVNGIGEEFFEYIGEDFVSFDPRNWSPDMAVRVGTALGRGNDQQRLAMLASITGKQEAIITQAGVDNPIAPPQSYYNALADMVELSGLPGAQGRYFTDPSKAPPQQPKAPPPDPNAGLVQAEQVKAQAMIQAAREKHRNDLIIAAMKDETERRRIETNALVDVLKSQVQVGAQVDLGRINATVEHRSNLGELVTTLLQLHQDAESSDADRSMQQRQMAQQQAQPPQGQPQ